MMFTLRDTKTGNRGNTEKVKTASSVASKGQGNKIKRWQAVNSASIMRCSFRHSLSLLLEYGEILVKTLILNEHCAAYSKAWNKLNIFSNAMDTSASSKLTTEK